MPRPSRLLPENDRRSHLWIAASLFAVTVLTYWRSLSNGFVNFDDRQYVANPFVQQGLSWPSLHWALTTLDMANWHPLTWISLEVDHDLFGLNPAGYHATSLLLHAVNSVFLFGLLARMTGAVGPSACVAALFALHPLHVESVAWVAERKDVLSGFFWLATMGLYYRYCRQPGWLAYAAVLASFTLGLMSKPMLVTLPFVLLLMDYWPVSRTDASFAWLITEKIPLFALSAASSVITYLAQGAGGGVRTGDEYGLTIRLLSVPLNYVAYLRRTLWPADLAVMYPYAREMPPLWQPLAAVALLLGVTLLTVRLAKRFPYAVMGWLWFLGALVPVIGIVQVGRQATADRYMYMPIVGLLVVLCWGATDLAVRRRWSRAVIGTTTGLLLAGCAAATWLQIGYWHDSARLWRHALAVVPGSAPAYKLLAAALAEQGQRDEAEALFKESLRLEPQDEDTRAQLATLLWQTGRLDEAAQHFEILLEANRDSPVAYHDMGYLAERRGELDAAIGYYRQAVRLDPNYAAAHQRLGRALIERGDRAEGERHLAEAARLEHGSLKDAE